MAFRSTSTLLSFVKNRLIRRLVDNTDSRSASVAMRRRRMRMFHVLIRDLPPPIRVLDVGGTERFWLTMGIPPGVSVVLLNRTVRQPVTAGIRPVVGDAREMGMFRDGEFDIVFSNSVIEHVGSFSDQAAMAQEVQRVGRRFYVQTPNRYFPLEPHFLFPGFQFLPLRIRAWLHSRFDLGWMKRAEDKSAALQNVMELRLLSRRELESLFPGAQIWVERFLGFAKSYVAYGRSPWAGPAPSMAARVRNESGQHAG